jgi:hypothetical protein
MGNFIRFQWQAPFRVRESGTSGCEVMDANGNIVCWTGDLPTALLIAGLLELQFESGPPDGGSTW